MVERIVLICAGILLPACGEQPLVYVASILPVDGGDISLIDVNDPQSKIVWSDAADTDSGLCLSADGRTCSSEPLYAHSAVIRFANDYPQDSENPLLGQVTIESFALQLSSAEEGAPELEPLSGGVGLSLSPGERHNVVVPLVEPGAKFAYARAAGWEWHRYTGSYRFRTSTSVTIEASTSVNIGPYINCPADTTPVGYCPVAP